MKLKLFRFSYYMIFCIFNVMIGIDCFLQKSANWNYHVTTKLFKWFPRTIHLASFVAGNKTNISFKFVLLHFGFTKFQVYLMAHSILFLTIVAFLLHYNALCFTSSILNAEVDEQLPPSRMFSKVTYPVSRNVTNMLPYVKH